MTGPTEREAPEAILARAEEITAFSIDSQSDPFLPTSWAEKVIDPDVTVLVERFPGGQLTRGDLFELGDAARDGDLAARHQLVLATFMWGYGTRGGRSYANARKTLADPTLDRRLAATTKALVDGDLGAAYGRIDGLEGYGEGFFTKYLYFAAHGAAWEGKPKPLIFDSLVRSSLAFITDVLGTDWKGEGRPWGSVMLYLHYCETLARWAGEVTAAGHRCTPDQIEWFLFSRRFKFDVNSTLRALAAAALTDRDKGRAGPDTLQALRSLPRDLVVSLRFGAETT